MLFEKGGGWRLTRFQFGPGAIGRILNLIADRACGWEKERERTGQTMKRTRVDLFGREPATHHRSNERAANLEAHSRVLPTSSIVTKVLAVSLMQHMQPIYRSISSPLLCSSDINARRY